MIAVGAHADLCLLDAPWARAREELSGDRVVANISKKSVGLGGNIVFDTEIESACAGLMERLERSQEKTRNPDSTRN